MITIHLKEFVKTGRLGDISIGSTKNDLIKAFGTKFSFYDSGETQIIMYGWYEFFYWTETELIFGIQNDHLVADCANHKDMIECKYKKWTLDTWFLQVNKNITFSEVEAYLTTEEISYKIVPMYEGCAENIIKCSNSNVTFDFVNEYSIPELDKRGRFKNWKEFVETDQSNFVLNGIRLFEY